jgi:hypothetical protein
LFPCYGRTSFPVRAEFIAGSLGDNAVCQRFSFPAALDGFAARADRLLSHFKSADEFCFRKYEIVLRVSFMFQKDRK